MAEQCILALDFPEKLEWFNTDEPVNLVEQKGKVVIINFWTYSSIDCLSVLSDLCYLNDKYPESLSVIGVHTPKFHSERIRENIQNAIHRNNIIYPVVHDPGFDIWKTYGARAWPTLIVIGPDGCVLGKLSGEGHRDKLEKLVCGFQKEPEEWDSYKSKIVLSRVSENDFHDDIATLRFPGKLCATGSRLYISDTWHNRILETNLQGSITRIFGSTVSGLADGQGEYAAFNRPQGIEVAGGYVYVADAGNHAIRRIDLRDKIVDTIAGNGQKGSSDTKPCNDPLKVALNSPWDLFFANGVLYIAMAGQHNIWRMQLSKNSISVFSGTGREGIVDGRRGVSAFSQPSGMAYGNETETVYVADAGTSAIREIHLEEEDSYTSTLTGTGLFEFGDIDGPGKEAKLQYPMGIAYSRSLNTLFIADTYNNKIKTLNLINKRVNTLECGDVLKEPCGISLYDNILWVANTNAHEIIRLDIKGNIHSGEVKVGKIQKIEVKIPDVCLEYPESCF